MFIAVHCTMKFFRFHNFWLPRSFVLTLADTPERTKAALADLNDEHKFNCQPYDGFSGKKMGLTSRQGVMTQGMIGCLLSHMSLWKMLCISNDDAYLIFEDDIYLMANAKQAMTAAYRFALPSDWNVVFWGCCWRDIENMEYVNKSFQRARQPPLCFHAYMIRKQTAKYVLPKLDLSAPLDMQTRVLFSELGGVYVFEQDDLARQRSLVYTDISDRKVPVVSVDDGLFSSQTCERK